MFRRRLKLQLHFFIINSVRPINTKRPAESDQYGLLVPKLRSELTEYSSDGDELSSADGTRDGLTSNYKVAKNKVSNSVSSPGNDHILTFHCSSDSQHSE